MREILKERWKGIALILFAVLLLGGAFFFPERVRSLLGVSRSNTGNFNVPKYTGRPVNEFRAVPEEVKLFNEQQMEVLKKRLSDAAGSINADPDQLAPWIDAGVVKKVIGDYEGARDAWEYASIIRPLNYVSFKNLGELYWHYLPDLPRSEENFRTAIKNDPSVFDAYISLSDLYRYSYKEKEDLADDVLLEGLEKNPKLERNFIAYIARYYKETGNISKAIEFYAKFSRIEPENQDVKEELAKLKGR
ncbi:MAG: hypothetical protein HYT39_02975 [Candidatus Sungbacteria bacterium]|nr:hypothetical protein [Candidatus Sungbacteria bacterium]